MQNKKQGQLFIFALMIFVAVTEISMHEASAKTHRRHHRKPAGLCAPNVATSTMYFVPKLSDYCSTSELCTSFKKEVAMQGSGTLPGNQLLLYSGKKRSLGSCDTAFGASGQCLTPYISVAADPRYYNMGDIIQMPALTGKKMTLPNGQTFIHPGYLIVQDKGSAILGKNRFDFFTGSLNADTPKNAFGRKGSINLDISSKDQCLPQKKFEVIRRNSSGYERSMASISDALGNSYFESHTHMASADIGGGR